jgi:hypothetical protein
MINLGAASVLFAAPFFDWFVGVASGTAELDCGLATLADVIDGQGAHPTR